ncbi:hypothetical protein [uncultured Draconibacterium sp.]|uniref:hypothetical protein n=1 Tax=uncultured Draconibacterium sp. TaxID=1573823 RepID=UPI0025CCA23B|nr:hypothetical protein [uncultured Draconibacterium sp.]
MYKLYFILIFVLLCACVNNRYKNTLPKVKTEKLKLLPEFYFEKPTLNSPSVNENSRELILLKSKDGKFFWMDGTVENGEPFNLKKQLFGKGNQFTADDKDFPTFAKTGIHSTKELINTKIITGKSVSQITVDGRPWASSGVGFLAEDETIMSVIYADNITVDKINLTHADIARPLFHFWNVARNFDNLNPDLNANKTPEIEALIYNGNEVKFKIQGSRGWQESIFNDEILGTGHLEFWRELNPDELDFLQSKYSNLSPQQFQFLTNKLSHIHTGEMVFFYINRYGFYEGHNEYRPDPISVVIIFGLTTIEKVHKAVGGDLYSYFNKHFTQNPN